MNNPVQWRQLWEEKAAKSVSDYEFDRGTTPRAQGIEALSQGELVRFIEPQPDEIVFDAGCGTGANIFLLHSKVKRVVGMDCTAGALARCQRRVDTEGIHNVELCLGDVTSLPASDNSVDKVLCLSVFQYLDDAEVRTALKEFARVLKSGAILILHVKNKSSLYLSTLIFAKKLKSALGRRTKLEHFRSYQWYVRELRAAGFKITDYNSFNTLMLEGMPKKLLRSLQRLELKRYNRFPFRTSFVRKCGSELKLRARIDKPCQTTPPAADHVCAL